MTGPEQTKSLSGKMDVKKDDSSYVLHTAPNPGFGIFGVGVLKGLFVTLKNFMTSYFRKPDNGGIFTVQYPEERAKEIEAFRNFPFLVYDGTSDKIRCVACGICERECPVKCIHIEMETDAAKKPLRRPAVFEINYGLCMNCGMCEDVCPFDSIYMDHAFEVASAERERALVLPKESLLKSNDYFRKIRPDAAALVDQKRRAAEEKKKAAAPPAPKTNL